MNTQDTMQVRVYEWIEILEGNKRLRAELKAAHEEIERLEKQGRYDRSKE